MEMVYVAGPYSTGDIEANIVAAEDEGLYWAREGYAVHIPHKNTSGWEDYTFSELTYGAILNMDMEMVKRADIVVFLPTFRSSPGAMQEHAVAKHNNKKIYYRLETGVLTKGAGHESK